VGAFLLTPLGEALTAVMERAGVNAPGVKAIFYGVILIAIISLMPSGVWPRLVALFARKGRAP
jgi:branched-chain amino acid transport system permease protein